MVEGAKRRLQVMLSQFCVLYFRDLTRCCSDVYALCDVLDALQAAARSLHRDTSAAAAAALVDTVRQGCKDVQLRAVFLAQVNTPPHSPLNHQH